MSRPLFARRLGQAVRDHKLRWALGGVAVGAIVTLASVHFVVQVGVPWGDVQRLRRGTVDLPLGGGPDVLNGISARSVGDSHEMYTNAHYSAIVNPR